VLGPVTLRQPFLSRVNVGANARADSNGRFAASAAFTAAGLDHEGITVGSELLAPDGCSLVLASFNVTARVSTRVEAYSVFFPGYAMSESVLQLAVLRQRSFEAPVVSRTTVFDYHATSLGRRDDGTRLVNRRLLLLAGLDPPTAAGEQLQFLMSWTAIAAGGGAASAEANVSGTLDSVTVVGA